MNIISGDKIYNTSNTMVYSCQYHVIFATKYRRKVLTDEIQVRLKEIITEISLENDFKVIEMETMPDHVHLLLDVNPNKGIYNIINKIKGRSSFILRKEFKSLTTRLPTLWTRSKFISTVGAVSLEIVKKYIEDQKNK